MTQLKKDIFDFKYALISIILYCFIMQSFFSTVCPIKAFFKINCPGCGLTHAFIYLFIGQLDLSIKYNPTAILWIIAILFFCINRYIRKTIIKAYPYLFIIASISTILWYIINSNIHFHKIF